MTSGAENIKHPRNLQKDHELLETKQKYLRLNELYREITTILKQTEKELKKTHHKELALKINDKQLGAKELIAALKKQNSELIKLNATKDKFISIIAHDLRSPFNSIIGFSKLLHKMIHEKNFDSAERMSEIILQSANNAMDLLTELLEWALMQIGTMEFKPEKINLLEVLKQVEPLLADAASQKGITIRNNVPKETILYADQEMVSFVLRNLISNAIKFTNQQGMITISVEQSSSDVIISVADTGIGIPKDMIKNLFHIDKNYKRSGTNKERGTGLGLVLCKEFVEKLGGKIWVKSEEGEGSTFYFSLPTGNV